MIGTTLNGSAAAADPLAGLDVDQRQLDERIYAALRERILSSELAPGTTLAIRDIAARLGVSVTPVRDALRRLHAEGLVQIRGRGETTVTQLQPSDLEEIFDLRLAYELHAVRRGLPRVSDQGLKQLSGLLEAAAKTFRGNDYLDYPTSIRLDGEFHRTLIAAAGSERLRAAYEALGTHVHIARVYYTRRRRPQETHAEHRAILDAYRHRDASAAGAAVEAHVMNTSHHIAGLLGTKALTGEGHDRERDPF